MQFPFPSDRMDPVTKKADRVAHFNKVHRSGYVLSSPPLYADFVKMQVIFYVLRGWSLH